MERALYGPDGFYTRGERPAAHFRTSVHASQRFAQAVARLVTEMDEALGHPPRFDLVDVGAGSGELLAEIAPADGPGRSAAPDRGRGRPAPGRADARRSSGATGLPDAITGLVIANEWLDNVPLDVVELTGDGPQLVVVDPSTGAELPGTAPTPEDTEWLERWWPLREPGDRAEIGRHRCTAWASVVERMRGGMALAIDYAHERDQRPGVRHADRLPRRPLRLPGAGRLVRHHRPRRPRRLRRRGRSRPGPPPRC